ncbi:MAG: hypothetical protein FWC24_04405 [Treponema sp.]|nr:hypothetical protein [Treponema sp.]
MKKMALALALISVGMFVYAQANLPEYYPVSGKWASSGGRLYQNDESARLAKANIPALQDSEVMIYEFDARYEGGAEDGHGGFGLHIFVDTAHNSASWGAGKSYLIWLNYDETPQNKNIQPGLSAQLYRSLSNSQMELVESFDMNDYADLLTDENLAEPVFFKIIADASTGEIHVYDPTTEEEVYYVLNMDENNLPITGKWVVLRTNGMKMSFAPAQ